MPTPKNPLSFLKPAATSSARMSTEATAQEVLANMARAAGQKAPITATKDLTTLEDFSLSLGDQVRKRAVDMQNMVESMPFKYDKGDYVTTNDGPQRGLPHMEILGRTLSGNGLMRGDHPTLGPGRGAVLKDPNTGKALRTPHEPGYRYRQEFSDGTWHEGTIPESAISQRFDFKPGEGYAAGGVVHMDTGGRMSQENNPFAYLANVDYSSGPPREAMIDSFMPGTNPMARQAAKQKANREATGLTPIGALLSGFGTGWFGQPNVPQGEDNPPRLGYSVMDPATMPPKGREAEMQGYKDIGTALGIGADPASMLAPLAKPAAKAIGRGALTLAQSNTAYDLANRAASATGAAPLYAVKPKGGNWQPQVAGLSDDITKATRPLIQRGPTTRDEAIAQGGIWRMQTDQYGQQYTLADQPQAQAAMANTAALNRWVLGALARTAERGVERALKAAPQDEALRLAQLRAALPPAQGGLGLPANNTPMQRAKAMGGKEAVHFSRHGGNYKTLDSGKFAIAPFDAVGTHVGTPKAAAERFENTVGYKINNPDYAFDELKGANYPVVILNQKPLTNQNAKNWSEEELNNFLREVGGHNLSELNNLRKDYRDMNAALRKKLFEQEGYTSIPYVNEVEGKGDVSYIVPPDNIRSRFAAFDPWRRDAATAIAFGVAAPDLLAKEQEPEKELTIEEFLKRMKAK